MMGFWWKLQPARNQESHIPHKVVPQVRIAKLFSFGTWTSWFNIISGITNLFFHNHLSQAYNTQISVVRPLFLFCSSTWWKNTQPLRLITAVYQRWALGELSVGVWALSACAWPLIMTKTVCYWRTWSIWGDGAKRRFNGDLMVI